MLTVGTLLPIRRILWTGQMAIRTDTTSVQLAMAQSASSKDGRAGVGIRLIAVVAAARILAGEPGANRSICGGPLDHWNLHAGRTPGRGKAGLDDVGTSVGVSDSAQNCDWPRLGRDRQRTDCGCCSRDDVRIGAPIDPMEGDGAGNRGAVHPAARGDPVPGGDLGREIVRCGSA